MTEEHRSESIGEIGNVKNLKNQEHEGSSGLGDNENERGQRQERMKKYWVVCSLCTKAGGREPTQAQGSPDSPPVVGRQLNKGGSALVPGRAGVHPDSTASEAMRCLGKPHSLCNFVIYKWEIDR